MLDNLSFKNYNEAIQAVVSDASADIEGVISLLYDEEGYFYVDEGPLHDYKQTYPFSSSDSYFGGIVRLICAFHNSFGGIILFGIHDKERTAGRNKVRVDSEIINRKLRESLSSSVEVSTFDIETPSGQVQILSIPPRPAMVPPVYPIKNFGDVKSGTVYLRRGAEVLGATGADIPFLYGERSAVFSDIDTSDTSVPASLPPSPATIQEFVGRFYAIERLATWVQKSRDPRLFLWGQGGSGKSTIAYEFASIAADSGRRLKNRYGMYLDRVLYISGKSIFLNPHTGKIESVNSSDFESADDVFRSILNLSAWDTPEKIKSYSHEACLNALEELFEIETQFIVIDDIDTLTTSNKDAGMEELFSILSRAKSGTKVLYTQRGFPSFAANAAVEVPSLNDGEMSHFVKLCCEKFKVVEPNSDEYSRIAGDSEGRPLAIETIIGMRRISPDYQEAFRRWKENSGEPRRYLFSREYQQLGKDDRARHVLAVLAIMDGPQSFEVLRDILQFSPEQLADALSESRDMFLRVGKGASGSGDSYAIGAATRLFITETSSQLDRYASIEARVKHFRTKSKTTPAAFIPLINRAARNLSAGNVSEAIKLLDKDELPPAFREHPEVKALLGQAYSKLSPPNVMEARKCFEAAYTLGHRYYGMYIAWLDLERENKTEIVNGISICNKVLGSDGFEQRTRATFRKRLARFQALRANDIELASPEECSSLRNDSVISNILAYHEAESCQDASVRSYLERAENSISIGLRRHLREYNFDQFFDLLERILSLGIGLDEIMPILMSRTTEIMGRPHANPRPIVARLNRLNGKVSALKSDIIGSELKNSYSENIKSAIQVLSIK
jgi:hypothetical protein